MMIEPRNITPELLNQFLLWTKTADMFTSSPEGRAFGEELSQIIEMAKSALLNPP